MESKCRKRMSPISSIFLEDQIPKNERTMTPYFQRVTGYILTGNPKNRLLFFFPGISTNGKSAFQSLMKKVFGSQWIHVGHLDILNLSEKAAETASPMLHKLIGARGVNIMEGSSYTIFDEAKIKSLTGNDTISSRPLHGAAVDWKPNFTVTYACNTLPFVRLNEAVENRIVVVPFDTLFVNKPEKPHHRKMLDLNELYTDNFCQAFLFWTIQGQMFFLQEEQIFTLPPRVKIATQKFGANTCTVAMFCENYLEHREGSKIWTPFCEIYNYYQQYAKFCGRKPESGKYVGERLRKLYDFKASNGSKYAVEFKLDAESMRAEFLAIPSLLSC